MTKTTIFDAETLAPDPTLTERETTLLGFNLRYERVSDQLNLLLNKGEVDSWSRGKHGGVLPIAKLVADQYPLVVFHGDVGTGKTAIAECIANRLLKESRTEDALIFRLSNRVRGSGLVGEMGSLLAEAFERVTKAVGRNRRAVLIIDEGDSIAASRAQDQSHHEDKVAVNTLIQGIDDMRRLRGRVAVILCTNRLSALDPALLRRAAIVEKFERPSEQARRELLEMDLAGLKLEASEIEELVSLSGPTDERPGWTFSDFRTRFYPKAVAKAFPDSALTFECLKVAAQETSASRVMEDR
ncbi:MULTISPECIES: AAA family ATPase [Sphingomonadales]|uniref:ATP-binding protein n=1 Tax=Qipengyuania gelatinilytica TaxID=2867231 RepID=A0ABX9A171_9SPHN|nr:MULTISPECIES: ATP-binding protein [Sphingomonadales]KPM21744.1 ATPase [Citromicrobium sp. RCC1885]KPM23626.1 ATPase [Citromicrobium sp. RCC1878]OAM06840.1 ATPase [Citromicrobium sp. RCC1897]QZD94084.1 ATP-binding protein [Qipengyuania gelatinilytica]